MGAFCRPKEVARPLPFAPMDLALYSLAVDWRAWMAEEALEGFFVTGTDTNVGKTVVSAWLVAKLDACYWKPVQAGTRPETDSAIVRRLADVPAERILPEAYVLSEPIAPHEAARRSGITIDMAKLVPPACNRPLVVEGAGGLMVPLTDDAYVIDLATELHLPVVLVSRSTLGTINHTLLSLEAIRRRGLPLAGVVINGPETPHNRAAIERYGQVEVIAEIPWLDAVTPSILMAVEPELDLAKLAKAEP
jgi:dethiobiotin synthetase